MNDPNGLVYVDGTYHLFFQCNPRGNTWANMSWGHATSLDLVHWTEHPIAMHHTPHEEVYSGSIVVDRRNTSGLGTNAEPPLVALYTSKRPDGGQAQSVAWSSDRGATWTRYAANPVLDRDSTGFRDPKVFWCDRPDGSGYWVMAVVEAADCCVLLYRSDDLIAWTHLSTFGAPRADDVEWECPDLFPLAIDGDPGQVAWVLMVGVHRSPVIGGSGTRYFTGHFDGARFTSDSDGAMLDHGPDLYAAATFHNAPDDRRILMGWMNNWDYAREVPTTPWRGTMSLPRELALRTVDGTARLVQRPVPELASLVHLPGQRTCQEFDLVDELSHPGSTRFRLQLAADRIHGDLTLDLLTGEQQRTRLNYSPDSRTLTLDRRASGRVDFSAAFPAVAECLLPDLGGRLELEVWVDRTSIEVFAQGGLAALTAQVFGAPEQTGLRLATEQSARITELHYQPLDATGSVVPIAEAAG